MDFPLNAEIFCKDGYCGRSTRVILKPKTEEVTHIVVKAKAFPYDEFLVPVAEVTATTPDSINISLTRGELVKQEPFAKIDYVEMNIPAYGANAYALRGTLLLDPELIGFRQEQIPEDELSIRRGARVEAIDGNVGHVDAFVVDQETEFVTHLVMREGHLWGKREVTIPVSAIDHLEEDKIILKLSKAQIEALFE